MHREEYDEMRRDNPEKMDDPEGGWMHRHGGRMGWGGMGRKGWAGMGKKGWGCPALWSFMAVQRGMGMMPGMSMGGMAPWRRFVSYEEKVARLEGYLKQLQLEEKAVQEKIDVLKKKESP